MHTRMLLRMPLRSTLNLVFPVSLFQHSLLRTQRRQSRPRSHRGQFFPQHLPVPQLLHRQQLFLLQQQPRAHQPVIPAWQQTVLAQLSTKVPFKRPHAYRHNKVEVNLLHYGCNHSFFLGWVSPVCLDCHRSSNDHQS